MEIHYKLGNMISSAVFKIRYNSFFILLDYVFLIIKIFERGFFGTVT